MKIDRSKINLMPLIRGPLWDQNNLPGSVFASVESLILQYETEPEAIPPLLPDPYKPGKTPTVGVVFNDFNGVDFMAGGGYRLGAVTVSAQIDGEHGPMEGNYVLVMPENRTLPIMTGREWAGMPKFFTDISAVRRLENDHLRCEASLWGHLLFGIEVFPPLKRQNALIRKAAGIQATRTPLFGYKYIASFDGPPDADYPTILWSDNTIHHLQLGKAGRFYFGNPTEQDIGEFLPIIDALKSLPVLEVKQTAYSRGSMVQRNDKIGRIR